MSIPQLSEQLLLQFLLKFWILSWEFELFLLICVINLSSVGENNEEELQLSAVECPCKWQLEKLAAADGKIDVEKYKLCCVFILCVDVGLELWGDVGRLSGDIKGVGTQGRHSETKQELIGIYIRESQNFPIIFFSYLTIGFL